MTRTKSATARRTPRREHELATGSGAPEALRQRPLEIAIGAEVRTLRRQLDLSVHALAESSGLSVGMLSKIENGQDSPSPLARFKRWRARSIFRSSRLFSEFEERRDCSYVRAGTGVVIDRRGTKVGHQYRLLGASLAGDLAVEPYLITLAKGAVPYTGFHHEGMEFLYMLEGQITYRHGDSLYGLRPGDSLMFDSTAQHGPEKLDRLPARYLSIIVYKR